MLEIKLLGEERDMKVAVGSEDVEGWMGWEVWWWLFALLSLLLLYYYCYRSRGWGLAYSAWRGSLRSCHLWLGSSGLDVNCAGSPLVVGASVQSRARREEERRGEEEGCAGCWMGWHSDNLVLPAGDAPGLGRKLELRGKLELYYEQEDRLSPQ